MEDNKKGPSSMRRKLTLKELIERIDQNEFSDDDSVDDPDYEPYLEVSENEEQTTRHPHIGGRERIWK